MRIRDNQWTLPQKALKNVINFNSYPLHDCIWSITRGPDDKIYFALGAEGKGESARLMVYDPGTEKAEEISDLAVLCRDYLTPGRIPNSKVHFSLCVGKNGMIYGATHPTAPPPGEELFEPFGTLGHPDCGYTGSFLFSHNTKTGHTENLGLLCPDEGVRTMVLDPEREIFYGLSYPRVHFFSFDLNTGIKTDYGRVAMTGAFDLFIDSKGRVFSTNDAGWLYCFDPDQGQLIELGMKIPGLKRRQSPYNFLFYPFRSHKDDGWMYGGTYFDGHIFRFHPDIKTGGAVEDLGFGWGQQPDTNTWCAEYVQAPEFGTKERIYYGFAGIWENVHLVCFDTVSGKKTDLGKISIDGMDSGWLSDSTASADGKTIYFADITMTGQARLLVFEPDDEMIEQAESKQQMPASQKQTTEKAPDIREEFDLQASEIMPVSPMFRNHAFPYVDRGQVQIRELNFYDVSPSIPPGECAVNALLCGKDRRIYGITGGRKCHLFAYDPYPVNDHVVDLATIESDSCCGQLICDDSGIIYGGICRTGEIFAYDPAGDYSIFWTYKTGEIKILSAPVQGEKLLCLCENIINGKIFGLTAEGTLFAYEIKSGRTKKIAKLEQAHLSAVLVVSGNNIYGAVRNGTIFKVSARELNYEQLEVKVPCGKGRDFQNEWTAAMCCPDGTIYGGTKEGNLFSFDPDKIIMTNLGKPVLDVHIRCLTRFVDGRIFGVAGSPERICHLFSYEPQTGNLADLGIPAVNFPKPWVGYQFNTILTSPKGVVYLGESDRISHLFIYTPCPNNML